MPRHKQGPPERRGPLDPEVSAVVNEMNDQFKEMHEQLDKLTAKDSPQVEAIKEQTRQQVRTAKEHKEQTHRQTRGVTAGPHVELGKDTRKDILSALKNIRSQITVSQSRENTMADVAAEHLAGGGTLGGAASAAVGFKKSKIIGAIKRKFDPLNIVHRMTGGSKLATVMAGRLMGRSEKSIRGAAGLQGGFMPGAEEAPFSGAPTPYAEDQDRPSPVSSDKSTGLLEQMAASLGDIVKRVVSMDERLEKIEGLEQDGVKYAKETADHLEFLHDQAELDKHRFHKKDMPTKVGKLASTKPEKSWLETVTGWLSTLGGAAMAFGKTLGKLLSPFKLLGAALVGIIKLITSGVKLMSGAILTKMGIKVAGKTLEAGADVAKAAGTQTGEEAAKAAAHTGKLIEHGVKGAEAIEQLKEGGKGIHGAAKLAEKGATKVAPELTEGAMKAILKKSIPKVLMKGGAQIAGSGTLGLASMAAGLLFASQKLAEGDVTGAVLEGFGGVPLAGIPFLVASVIRDAYSDIFSKPGEEKVQMETDPEWKKRTASLAPMAYDTVKNFLSGEKEKTDETGPTPIVQAPQTPDTDKPEATFETAMADFEKSASDLVNINPNTPEAAPELSPSAMFGLPSTGDNLTKAAEAKRDAEVARRTEPTSAPQIINNNVRNNTSHQNNIHQGMAPVRKDDTSWIRQTDRVLAPA